MNLESKSIRLRLVEESDADLILNLRTDENLNRFLSTTKNNLKEQQEWIKKYKEDEAKGLQFYFIIERIDGTPCGTVRIYDINDDSFCWGSWILNQNKTRSAAIESAFLVYQFGFEKLKLTKSHFEVSKENNRVISFHEKMGAIKSSETAESYLFEISKNIVLLKKNQYLKKIK